MIVFSVVAVLFACAETIGAARLWVHDNASADPYARLVAAFGAAGTICSDFVLALWLLGVRP